MTTSSTPVSFRQAAVVSLGATCIGFAYAVVETWQHAMPADAAGMLTATAFAARAAVLFVTGPALFLAMALSALERWTQQLSWLPHALVTAGVLAAVWLKPEHWWALFGLATLFFIARSTPWLREPDAVTIRVSVTVATLAVMFAFAVRFHWGGANSDTLVRNLVADSLLIFAPVSYLGSAMLRFPVLASSLKLRRLSTATFFAVAVAGSAILADLYFSLYIVPKLFLVAAAVCAFVVLLLGTKPISASVPRRHRLAALVLGGAWGGTALLTLALPVTMRFGPYPLESMVGFSAAALSIGDDRDLDGYYDVSAGGFDCAPRQRSTPLEIARCVAPDAVSSAPSAQRTFQAPVRHVFVIVVDTLRPDEIGASETPASGRRSTPGFAQLMERGVTFRRAYGTANSTYLAFRPMLSGVNPLEFLERGVGIAQSPHHLALAAQTGLFSFRIPERRTVLFQTPLFPKYPMYIGQEAQDTAITGLTTDSVIDAAAQWLDGWAERGRSEAILMTLYTHDPHANYECADGSSGGRRCYRDELENVDRGLARLQRLLADHDLWKDSIVVVLSDHGEAFGEHNQFFHASSLFEEQIRIPLIIAHPRLAPGTTIDVPVSAMSLVATLSDATHAAAPEHSRYDSLLPLATTRAQAHPPPVAHDFLDDIRWYPSRRSAIVDGRHKLIHDWGGSAPLLFDLEADPGETVNLAADDPETVSRLRLKLAATILSTARP